MSGGITGHAGYGGNPCRKPGGKSWGPIRGSRWAGSAGRPVQIRSTPRSSPRSSTGPGPGPGRARHGPPWKRARSSRKKGMVLPSAGPRRRSSRQQWPTGHSSPRAWSRGTTAGRDGSAPAILYYSSGSAGRSGAGCCSSAGSICDKIHACTLIPLRAAAARMAAPVFFFGRSIMASHFSWYFLTAEILLTR